MKRYKWKSEEDRVLISVMEGQPDIPDWDEICNKLLSYGIVKDRKQVKIRWKNHLSQNPIREEWSIDESCRLLEEFVKIPNKWTEISLLFEGRSDNCIKNRIFSLIRKALRMVYKLSGNDTKMIPSKAIGKIKPSVMTEFACSTLLIPSNGKKVEMRMIDFVKEFAFGTCKEIKDRMTTKSLIRVEHALAELNQINKKYNQEKQRKRIKKIKPKIVVHKNILKEKQGEGKGRA